MARNNRCGNARCGAPLSAYNSGPLCGICRRGGWLPAHIWDNPSLQQALLEREFGAVITTIRRLAGVTQRDITAHTGLTQSEVSRFEAGTRELTHVDKMVAFLKGLGVPTDLWPIRTPDTALPGAPANAYRWDSPVDVATAMDDLLASNTAATRIQSAHRALDHIIDIYESDGPTGTQRLAKQASHLRGHLHQLLRGRQPPS
ncbi:helix-turn-helix domain-containing protein [Streptomyces sp. NPDC087300]|uniref:helix-turn-helix domain-containing protein n=1 Tax=Streptomyces sp. NPDC087300 TaxID=3365780 RepID=UPI00380B878A